MEKWTHKQSIELFHLLFLEYFGRVADKSLYAIKGGCNLRFFLLSPRYSEDLDLDIKTIGKETLQKKVERLLTSVPFKIALEAKGISLQTHTAPKQTETTQRWKIHLSTQKELSIPTKIEFSRRGMKEAIAFEPIHKELSLTYQIPPIFAHHYTKEVAFQQKLHALAGRKATQARDVFDLCHLIRCGVDPSKILVSKTLASKAIEAALSLSYHDFYSLVVAYFPPSQQAVYESETVWEQIVFTVLEALEH